jgi:NAD(P)-dependent dehydrogenase (short-subunit alcohol dehydrogenase family)
MKKMPSAVVVGVGAEQGLGGALSCKFASEGYHVFVAGRTAAKVDAIVSTIRSSGGSAEGVSADASKEADVVALFEKTFAPSAIRDVPDLIVFNAGNNKRMKFLDISAEAFEEFWRGGCFAGFLVGREAVRHLAGLGRGTLLFTGASASLRGKAGFAHFAAAKAGLRMISQSLAREFGPAAVHVAHVVMDGGIDGERLRVSSPARIAELGENGLLGIDAIAETYWNLHRQHPSAWSQEVDLRPFREVF